MPGGLITTSTGDPLVTSGGGYVVYGDGPPPTYVSGSVTASVSGTVLSVAEDTTTWNGYSNGTVTALYTFQYRATSGDAWIGLDTATTETSYDFTNESVPDGAETRILRYGVNNGGYDEAEVVASNVVTYSAGNTIYSYPPANYITKRNENYTVTNVIATFKEDYNKIVAQVGLNSFIKKESQVQNIRDTDYLNTRFKKRIYE